MRTEKSKLLFRVLRFIGGLLVYLREDILVYGCLTGILICTLIYFNFITVGIAVGFSAVVIISSYYIYDGNRVQAVLLLLVLHVLMVFGIEYFSVRYIEGKREYQVLQLSDDDVITGLEVIQRIDGHGNSTYTLLKVSSEGNHHSRSAVRLKAVIRGFTRYRVGMVCTLPRDAFILRKSLDTETEIQIQRYLKSKNLQGTVYSDRIECSEAERNVSTELLRWVADLKRFVEMVIYRNLSEPKATLLLGMIFGDEREYQDELNDGIRLLGLSHVVAASGSNVSYIENVLEKLLGKLFSSKLRGVIKIVALCLFALIAGLSGSVLRAVSTRCVKIVSQLVGRRVGDLRALTLASSLLLIFRPNLVDDVGFQLSLVAVLGLAVGGGLHEIIISNIRLGWVERGFDIFARVALPSFICAVFTIPITYLRFGAGSILTVIPNIIILPLLDGIFSVGIIATLISTVWAGSISIYLWSTLDLLLSMFVEFVEIGSAFFLDQGIGPSGASIMWLSLSMIFLILSIRYVYSNNYYVMGGSK